MTLDRPQVGLFGTISKINLTRVHVLIVFDDYNKQNYPCDERRCAIGGFEALRIRIRGLAFSAIASHMDRDEMNATSIFPQAVAPNLHELGVGGETYQQLSRSSGQLSWTSTLHLYPQFPFELKAR